jgi:oligoendopeptidase F
MPENDNAPEWLKPFQREFVDKNFSVKDAESIKPWVDRLLAMETDSKESLVSWLKGYSELSSIIGEDSSGRYVDMTCDTKDKKKKEAYLFYVREIQPKLSEWNNLLDKKFYGSPARKKLDPAEFARLDRMFSTSIELFDEKNIPIDVKLAELSQKYQGITGSWTVEFEGKKQTMPQMGKHLLATDRAFREKAWRAMTERRVADAGMLESLFDEMLLKRDGYAKNLSLSDYREYAFKSKLRDYTPDDCAEFHTAIEKTAVPLMRKIARKRRSDMKIDRLRPWDMAVDPLGRSPLEPFREVNELQDGVESIFRKIDPRLGERFASIRDYMDLDSRDGKAPGGYQTTYEEKRRPFIFTNAAGVHSDVITLLHEGGHAFHTLECRTNPFIWYRHASMEFSEVASMTQELFAQKQLDIFYGDKVNADRARLEQLERVVDIFPWVATVDAFQHWLYTNPGHTGEVRAEKWREITSRFEVEVDWSGLNPDVKKYAWHRQLHIFEVPFYYIEYAIAQLGALQLYRIYRDDPKRAVDQYLSALSAGGSRSPGELFKAAGISLDFSADMLKSLMEVCEEEIEAIQS